MKRDRDKECEQGVSFGSTDGQTPAVFGSNGPSCPPMMVHSVSDAVNSQELVEEGTSFCDHMLSSFFSTYGAVHTQETQMIRKSNFSK